MTKKNKERLAKAQEAIAALEAIANELHVSGLQTFDELEMELDKLGKDILKQTRKAARNLTALQKEG